MMRANGSFYVLVVVAGLVAYGTYQWWFNPHRAIKGQLGALAATLSILAVPRSWSTALRCAMVTSSFRLCMC